MWFRVGLVITYVPEEGFIIIFRVKIISKLETVSAVTSKLNRRLPRTAIFIVTEARTSNFTLVLTD